MIKYRWVFPSQPEFNVIREVIRKRGWTQPHPDLARALCAYDNGNHVGFIVIQLVNHIEPLFVAESYRGQGIAGELADRAIAYMKENNHPFLCMADNEHVIRMCEALELHKIESPVYRS